MLSGCAGRGAEVSSGGRRELARSPFSECSSAGSVFSFCDAQGLTQSAAPGADGDAIRTSCTETSEHIKDLQTRASEIVSALTNTVEVALAQQWRDTWTKMQTQAAKRAARQEDASAQLEVLAAKVSDQGQHSEV